LQFDSNVRIYVVGVREHSVDAGQVVYKPHFDP
jgi:hypothetical protein